MCERDSLLVPIYRADPVYPCSFSSKDAILPRDEDPDQLIFGPPDPVLFSADPDPDPTCNNGFIKLFLSGTKYKSESNSSIK